MPPALAMCPGASSQDVDEIRKQAYRAADIDTVKMIRELAMTMPQQAPSIRKDH
jgi:hypothetical protein